MKRILLLTLTVFSLAACSTTNPGSGAAIQYDLPKTNAVASLTMTLEKCPIANEGLEIDANMSIALTAGARGEPMVLDGSTLASIRTRRSVRVAVDDNGVISGVNAASTDRTATIISNTLSAITTLVNNANAAPRPGVSGSEATPQRYLSCKGDIKDHIQMVEKLRGQITGLRADLAKDDKNSKEGADPKKSKSEISEEIDALALEIARLRTGPLRKVLRANIPLGSAASPTPTALNFDYAEITEDWLEYSTKDGIPAREPKLTADELNTLFKAHWISNEITPIPALALANGHSRKLKTCTLSMIVPKQNYGTVSVKATGKAISKVPEASESAPITQWGPNDSICLSAGFAENRTIAVEFNAFGRRRNLAWTSEAQGETASSALSGIATSSAGFITALEGQSDVDRQRAAISRITTQIQYNNALLCEQAAREGATACPAPTEVE